MIRFISKSPEETIKIAMQLSKYILPGSIICLSGDLGAGKTAFTQGLGKGLGITDHITSPSYTIINEYYTASMPLYHFDVYRLESPDEIFELACDEYFFGEGVTIIEWAEKIKEVLPKEKLWITIKYGKKPNERVISMNAYGNKNKAILKEMRTYENTGH